MPAQRSIFVLNYVLTINITLQLLKPRTKTKLMMAYIETRAFQYYNTTIICYPAYGKQHNTVWLTCSYMLVTALG